jgi:hypothetical protein
VLGLALVATVATLAWMLYVASSTVGYLGPAISGAIDQVVGLIAGEEDSRELFRAATGQLSPLWEQVAGYASVALVLALSPFGLVVLWRRYRARSIALVLGMAALAYPVTQVARLTVRGAEMAARATEYVFLGVSFVAALAIVAALDAAVTWRAGRPARPGPRPDVSHLIPPPPPWRVPRPAFAVAIAGVIVLAVGGAVLAAPLWARLPGSYLVAADPRSIEPQGIAAASWSRTHLGSGNRFLADRTNRALLVTYGRQHPISAVGDRIDVKRAYFAEELTADTLGLLSSAQVRYAISDLRLPTSLPYVGVYVERGEQDTLGPWTAPMAAAAVAKWDAVAGAERVYDAGAIRIYDIGRLTRAAP